MFLSYIGIRVTNLEKSVKFYTELLGLREVTRGDSTTIGGGIYVLLKDPKSGQKLELNWYSAGSPYASPYIAGEGLDHISFMVDNVAEALQRLEAGGAGHVDLFGSLQQVVDPDKPGSFHMGYVRDPDGNWIELYDHGSPIGPGTPDGY